MSDVKPHQEIQRTDPRSFAVRAVAMLAQLVIPLAIASATILDDGDIGGRLVYVLPIVLVVVLANFAIAYLQWWRLTYAVGETDIRVESGVLSRAARSVPYERIQDVSLEQKLLPRLFGLTEVKFETGAGGGDDLKLSYLAEEEGERLRELVRERRDDETPVAVDREGDAAGQGEPSDVVFGMDGKRVLTFGLFEFSLAVVAVVGGVLQQFDFLIDFDLWDVEEWEQRLAGPGQWLAGLGPLAKVAGGAIAILSLVLVGVVTGVVRTVLREWDFVLERSSKGLRRRRGLLTRTDVVLPVHRVQALNLRTGFLRRMFGWHGLKVISLASDSGSSNHDAAPFATMQEIAPVVATTGFALPPERLDWQRADERYRFDRMVLDAMLLLPATLATILLADGTFWLVPAMLLAVALAHNYWRWRMDRHALDTLQVYTRRGWFKPRTMIGSRIKLQSAEIAQGPIARRRGYATLKLGLAGGTFDIDGLPVEQAHAWRSAICQSIARTDFSELLEQPAA
ncbi:MAG: hypothetical protein DI637_09600 [Citromicrobium sp.]|nr:MAG: hypothetical protein DI637_09600 [Citromicrobium sp.]